MRKTTILRPLYANEHKKEVVKEMRKDLKKIERYLRVLTKDPKYQLANTPVDFDAFLAEIEFTEATFTLNA